MQTKFTFHELTKGIQAIESVNVYYALKNDLIDHVWHKKGETSD